jgi:hypothetical protein
VGAERVHTWGVVGVTHVTQLAWYAAHLADVLDGIVELPCRGLSAGGGQVELLAAGLTAVPPHVQQIAFLGGGPAPMANAATVAEMIGHLDPDHAAVVRAAAVTDALKQVERDVVVRAVGRNDLYIPQPPHIIRRDALRHALTHQRRTVRGDTVSLLLAAGHTIRVLRDGGPPATLAARR